MKTGSRRSRRHRNPPVQEKQPQQPFFTKAGLAPVQAKEATPFFQPKLTIGTPGDPYEREADSVADTVVSQSGSKPVLQSKEISSVQRLATPDEEKMPGTNDGRMEEDKAIQEKPEAGPAEKEQEELPVQKAEAPKEEKEPVQKMEAPKEEKEPVQKMEAPEKEEEPPVQKAEAPKDEKEPVQKMEAPKKEEEPPVQTKANANGATQPANLSSRLAQRQGKGRPLPRTVRAQMEQGIGAGFDGVHIHTDTEAAELNKDLHAQAFTQGQDIYFAPGKYNPDNTEGQRLLAHELTHVVQQGGAQRTEPAAVARNAAPSSSNAVIRRAGLLDAAAENAAILHNRALFDLRSAMIIQIITGTTVDGDIGTLTVEAIASFQSVNGLTPKGLVDVPTLNALFKDRVVAGRHEHAIQLVVDYFNLNTADVLTIHHSPELFFSNTIFQPGGLRTIELGPFAFLGAVWLKGTIERELALKAPPIPAIGPRPDHLDPSKEGEALFFNASKYNDIRCIKAIQGLVGATPDGIFGSDTVERIAELQGNNGLTKDGKVGEQTLRVLVSQMNMANQQNTAIRLIIDFYNLNDFDALLDIRYDATLVGSNAVTPSKDIPGPDIIMIGPAAFAQGFEGLVHTIAHELEHIRQNKLGIADIPLSEFLGEAVEIISKGMPAEGVAGFFDDAGRAIANWALMQLPDQKKNWSRFVQVRDAVRQRYNAATAAEKATNQLTMDSFNAVAKPV